VLGSAARSTRLSHHPENPNELEDRLPLLLLRAGTGA
jgi:hypothetical protein